MCVHLCGSVCVCTYVCVCSHAWLTSCASPNTQQSPLCLKPYVSYSFPVCEREFPWALHCKLFTSPLVIHWCSWTDWLVAQMTGYTSNTLFPCLRLCHDLSCSFAIRAIYQQLGAAQLERVREKSTLVGSTQFVGKRVVQPVRNVSQIYTLDLPDLSCKYTQLFSCNTFEIPWLAHRCFADCTKLVARAAYVGYQSLRTPRLYRTYILDFETSFHLCRPLASWQFTLMRRTSVLTVVSLSHGVLAK